MFFVPLFTADPTGTPIPVMLNIALLAAADAFAAVPFMTGDFAGKHYVGSPFI